MIEPDATHLSDAQWRKLASAIGMQECVVWYPSRPFGRAVVRRPDMTGFAIAHDGGVTEYDEQGREVQDGG